MLPFSRVLVTGGAGFIGSHIVDQLIQEGCEVIVLDSLFSGNLLNLKESSLSKNLKFVKADINDKEVVRTIVRDVEVIFHQASIVSVPLSLREPDLTNQVNVNGTLNLLNSATNSGVQRFIFASSAAVYGNCQELPLKTTSPTFPISPYGSSKLAGEQLCLECSKATGLGVSILRYFNAYGPRSLSGDNGSVINKFMKRLVKLESPIITGNGEATRDFVYVKDIVRANIMSASNKNSIGKIYNVATGTKITMNELASLELRILLGPNLVIPFEYKPREKEDIIDSYADTTPIRQELGFSPRYSLEEGLTEYFRSLWTSLPIKWQEPIRRRRAS